MKNKKLTCFLICKSYFVIILCLLACSKPEILPTENLSEKGIKLLNSITVIKDIEIQKLAYSSLSDEERFEVWQTKFSKVMANPILTASQFQLIKIVKETLTLDYFQGGNSKAIFQTVFLKNWINKAKSDFTQNEIYTLLFTLDDDWTLPIARNPIRDCKCAVGSSYTCYNIEITSNGDAVYKFQNCSRTGSCFESESGCGALWDDECDGDTCTPY